MEQLHRSALGSNNSSWACRLRFYPCFATEPRFATEPLVLQTVFRFVAKPRFVTEPCFATVPRGTVRRNVQYSTTKCADLVRQNMGMWCGKMWWVWCDEMCGYGAAKCAGICCEMRRSAAMVRRNATMVRRIGDKWRPRATTDQKDLIMFANSFDFY